MKKIWAILLVVGLVMCGTYCQSAENTDSVEASKISMLSNADEVIGDAVNSGMQLVQLEGEDEGDDEGDGGSATTTTVSGDEE